MARYHRHIFHQYIYVDSEHVKRGVATLKFQMLAVRFIVFAREIYMSF